MKNVYGLALLASLVAVSVAGCTAPSATKSASDDRAATDSSAAAEPEAPSPGAWADEKFGTFTAVSQAGVGDGTVALPADTGLVTLTHDGASNFSVVVIDVTNAPTGDLLANTIGAYSGATAYGLNGFPAPATGLQISADGNWTVAIAPLSSAGALPASGVGDGVYLYRGGAASTALTHDGAANFSVRQYSDGLIGMDLLVNEIGPYQGTVPFRPGPALITIQADGGWTVTG